ncbi:MAG TPA: metallophosphoesterase family protein [Actinomycetota bacterium]|nr:metallophosphoesterase family protein [Actinomycetota bacterium]
MRSGLRRWSAPVLIGLAGAVLALWVLPASGYRLGPTIVELKAQLGTGHTSLEVTPFGTLTARTHVAPLDVTAALRQVDIEELGATITTADGRARLQGEIERQIPGLLRRAALTHVVAGVVVGGLLGAALFRQRRRGAAVAAVTALGTIVLLLGATALTYEQDRFAEASYSGSLARARQVIETVTEHTRTFDEARSRYQVAARRASELMVLLAQPQLDPARDTTAILHISDLHANPAGLEIAQQLAVEFGVAGVIDTGDLASSFLDTGELSALEAPIDRLMVRGIRQLDVPYLFVPGNHDSPRLRAAVARAPNATVLSGETASVAGVDVLGWADPTYSTIPAPESEKAEQRRQVADDVAAAVAREEPDILAVHDAVLASESGGTVPLVVSGHFHRRIVTESEGTRFLAVGSTGATGVKSLTVEADLRYEAEILYFDVAGRLVAVDYVTLKGLGEDFVLERNSFAAEPASAEL